MGSLSSLYSY